MNKQNYFEHTNKLRRKKEKKRIDKIKDEHGNIQTKKEKIQ